MLSVIDNIAHPALLCRDQAAVGVTVATTTTSCIAGVEVRRDTLNFRSGGLILARNRLA